VNYPLFSTAVPELRQLKDRVETILNSVGEALMVVSLDGRIQQVNPAFETHTGYSAVEVELEYHHELLLDVSMPTEVFKESTAAMRAGQIWRGEMPVRRKDGSIYEAAVTIVPMHDDDGKIKAFVGSLRDISALKELERMKDALVSTTIHELRTPLTSIRGFSEILLTRELDEERHRKYLEMINQKSEQLNNIIDDMLGLARLESGKMLESRPEPTNLDELIQEVLVPYDEMAPDHHFQTRGLEDLPPVQVDPFRITQVLRNLLSNAVKYSPEGGNIVIRGRVENDMAAISVEDEGLGMTREQQAHLFERFYRAHTAMNISGTGLGLTICKFIVEQHGGRIWVESRPNVGSTFTFTLPLDSSQTALEE
jgi:PAS domain S-box-containing protein